MSRSKIFIPSSLVFKLEIRWVNYWYESYTHFFGSNYKFRTPFSQ